MTCTRHGGNDSGSIYCKFCDAEQVALALKGGNAKMSTNCNGWNDRGLAHPDDVFGVLPGETSATVCRRDARECEEMEVERDRLKAEKEELVRALEGMLNTHHVHNEVSPYLEKGIGTKSEEGKAILAARSILSKVRA
jgi:hypothetical protein